MKEIKFLNYWNNLARSTSSRFARIGFPDADYDIYKSIVDEMFYYVRDINKDSNILEVGCGNGILLEIISNKGYRNLYGCDYSIDLLDEARIHCKNIKLVHVDAANINKEFTNTKFDLIYLHSVIQYFENYDYFEQFLESCLEILNINGKIFLGDVFNNYAIINDQDNSGLLNSIKSIIKKIIDKKKAVSNFYLDLNNLYDLPIMKRNKVTFYPILQWINRKPIMFKKLRYNILITKE